MNIEIDVSNLLEILYKLKEEGVVDGRLIA
jgi:hypothetical protein